MAMKVYIPEGLPHEMPQSLIDFLNNLKPQNISAGNRNNRLTSIAGGMRRKGNSGSEIAEKLYFINEKECDPPLSKSEVSKIAFGMERYEPAPTLLQFKFTDSGNAERIVHLYGESIRYTDAKGWFRWNQKTWEHDDAFIYRYAVNTMRQLAESSEEDNTIKFATKSENESKLNAMVNICKKLEQIRCDINTFDTHKYLFNCLNGTFDLEKMTLLPYDKNHMITKMAPVVYSISAKCPEWEKFLLEIMDNDKEMVSFIQKSIGIALSGDTSEEKFWVAYGTGANGKSKFLEVIQALFGDYALQGSSNLLLSKPNDGRATPEVARLKGARFVSCSETSEGKRWDDEVVKGLTGGDKITARFLQQNPFEFIPECKIWQATNSKPNTSGSDYGMWRRMLLIPFSVTIPAEKRDKYLSEKLKKELSGILNWAIEGYKLWKEEGLQIPLKVQQATEEYREDLDTIGQFIEECCIIGKEEQVENSKLHEVYTKWCEKNLLKPLSAPFFSRKIRERGFGKTMIGKRRVRGSKGISVDYLFTTEVSW